MGSPSRPFNPSELERIETSLRTFADFVRQRRPSRDTTPDRIDGLGKGDVDGTPGGDRGLVDELSGLNRAIAIAKEREVRPTAAWNW